MFLVGIFGISCVFARLVRLRDGGYCAFMCFSLSLVELRDLDA